MKKDSAGRSLTQEEFLETPDLEEKSKFYDVVDNLFSQRYTALQGERMATVKAAARRAYETLRIPKTGM